jgi:hypothetical protein
LASAGIEGLTLHGLRRSFGTLSEWVEVPAGIVAQIQGHKPSATIERHYRHRPLDLLRKWHNKVEAWILSEGGVGQPNDDTLGKAAGETEGIENPPEAGTNRKAEVIQISLPEKAVGR